MKSRTRIILACLVAAMSVSSLAHAATTGTADVTLVAAPHAMIQILTPTLTLTPASADYDAEFVEAIGGSGLQVRVKTNSTTGLVLSVRCADASPQIALADLLVRTATSSPSGGPTMSSYTAVSGTDQTLWTTGAAQHPWYQVATDVRVQNLFNYDAAVLAGTASYTNTLTYTVVTQ